MHFFAKRMPIGHENKQIQKSVKIIPYEMFSMKAVQGPQYKYLKKSNCISTQNKKRSCIIAGVKPVIAEVFRTPRKYVNDVKNIKV